MARPLFYNDWAPVKDNPDLEWSERAQLFYHKKKDDVGDKKYAIWAGWAGPGFQFKNIIWPLCRESTQYHSQK